MPERAKPVWNLRESGLARAQLDALAANHRFDGVWAGVRWLIIRDPIAAGRPVVGKEQTYALKTKDFLAIGLPVMLITYSIVDEKNLLLEIVSVLKVLVGKTKVKAVSPKKDSGSAKAAG